MTVVIPGRAVPKGRPRMSVRGRTAYLYTPEATVAYEQAVGLCARQQYRKPLEGPVELSIRVYVRRGIRGDLDNYVKAISDGLNGVAFVDDRQVVHIDAQILRCRAEDERVEVDIKEFVEVAMNG